MRYLGIDYGTKRIGLALSDETGSLAFPHSTIAANSSALNLIDVIIQKEGVGQVVVGESRNFQGERNAVMEDIEQFVADLSALARVPVAYEQEFFTSALAARQFAPDDSRKSMPKHDNLDASAAALILQSYLDRMKNKG